MMDLDPPRLWLGDLFDVGVVFPVVVVGPEEAVEEAPRVGRSGVVVGGAGGDLKTSVVAT